MQGDDGNLARKTNLPLTLAQRNQNNVKNNAKASTQQSGHSQPARMGSSEKRRSILFPFAKSTAKETKFEVVNRRKNPAQQPPAQRTSSPSPSPFDPPSGQRTVEKQQPRAMGAASPAPAPVPVPVPSAKPVSKQVPKPIAKPTSKLSPPPPQIKHKSLVPSEKLSSNDLPNPNLDVNFTVPPVPDYNNTLNAPPVTIKGRSVSLTKKDAPPRRKPPSGAMNNSNSSLLGGFNNQSAVSVTSSAMSYQSSKLDSKSVQEEEENIRSIDAMTDAFKDTQQRETPSRNEGIPVVEPVEQPLPPSIVVSVNKSDEDVVNEPAEPAEQVERQGQLDTREIESRTEELNLNEEAQPQPESQPQLQSQVEQIKVYNDAPFESVDSFQHSMTQPLTAKSPFIDATNNHSQADSFASASEFRDNSENSIVYETPNDTSQAEEQTKLDDTNDQNQVHTPPLQHDPIEHQQQKSPEQVQVELGDDPDSSFEVQPLFFHKKTKSGVSDITTSSAPYLTSPSRERDTKKGHGKQLSLSDDILRDIEEFQSAIPSHVQEDPDEVSPVQPLTLQGGPLAPPPQQEQRKSALYEEINYDGDDYYYNDYKPEVQPERQQLKVQNPDAEISNTDQGSLFQDSSDEDLSKIPKEQDTVETNINQDEPYNPNKFDYGHVGGLNNFDSRDSSVQPEIDYYGDNINDTSHKNRDDIPAPTPGRMGLMDDEDEDEDDFAGARGFESRVQNDFDDFNQEYNNDELYEQQLSIPRSQSFHNISDIGSPVLEGSSYNSNVPSSQVKSATTSGEDDRYNYDRSSRNNESDQESSYYAQASQSRKFHVVNTGDYSDEEDQSSRQLSYNQSFDEGRPDALNQNYSVIHQQLTSSTGRNRDSDDDEDEMLSFTAKSPIQSDFTFEPKSSSPRIANNMSDIDLSRNINSNFESPVSTTTPINAYDRREDTAAPVQYAKITSGPTRRPPPLSDAPKTTRAARSLSRSQPPPAFNYNTLQENQPKDLTVPQPESHEPEKSSYVEMLRLSSGTANSEVSARSWGVPIGIADIDHTKMSTHSSRTAYKRAQRTNKSDLKHGKIKPRLLASEVDDDDISTEVVSTIDGQSSINELEKSRTPSLHSPSQSISNFSPNRTPSSVSGFTNPGSGNSSAAQTALNRSGTLMNDKIGSQLGRSGSVMSTVKPVNNMTLYIANPDIEEDE